MLKKLAFLLFLLVCNVSVCNIQNDPFEVAVFGGEPSAIVDSCVNVITGDYFIAEDDWVIPGLEPIVIQRKYLSRRAANHFGGWELFFNHLKVERLDLTDGMHALRIPEKQGFSLWYLSKRHKKTLNYSLHGNCPEALTNCYTGDINGRLNAFNHRVYEDPSNRHVIFVDAADGTKRAYSRLDNSRKSYYLVWESLPNTNRIHYSWKQIYGEYRLESVTTTDASVSRHYATAKFNYHFGDDRHLYAICIKDANTQRFIRYNMRNDKRKEKKYWNIQTIDHPRRPNESFDYWQLPTEGLSLSLRKFGEGRSLRIDQYQAGQNQLTCSQVNIDKKDDRLGRVKGLRKPLGDSYHLTQAYEFAYDPGKYKCGGGATTVYDAYRNPTYYYYNKYFLLTEVKKNTSQGQTLFRETYEWYPYDAEKGSWLKYKTLLDSSGALVFQYAYGYDDKGNVACETLTGDLKGHGQLETFVIKREFHENNLVFREYFPNGKAFEYHYVPGTNLLANKLIIENGHLKIRHFYFYKGSALVKEISDDGSGRSVDDLTDVSERRIKKIHLRKAQPFIDLPDIVEEWYLDLKSNKDVLLSRKKIVQYNHAGLAETEEYSDSTEAVRYQLKYQYDGKERLIVHMDAEGNQKKLDYDDNNNIKLEQQDLSAFDSVHEYDFANRLIKTSQVSSKSRKLQFQYNFLHHKTKEIDTYNQPTTYQTDPLGNPLLTTYPALCDEHGNLHTPQVKKTYNALSKPIWEKDAEGNETKTAYTSRGLPKKIHYADGAEEFYTYDLNGNIASHLSSTGIQTVYTYDFLDRMTSKKIYEEDDLLSEETFSYNAFHLMAHTHPDGVITSYSYDGAGRKIKETTLDHIKEFSYDPLGRLSQVTEWCSDQISRIFTKKYDLLDRVILEKEEDQNGRCFAQTEYVYDTHGNLAETIRYYEDRKAKEITSYDCFKRVIRSVDFQGNETTIDYNDQFENGLGQTVLQKIITAPKGNQTIETYNTHGKIAQIEKLSSNGTCLLQEQFFYNLNAQKTKQISHLFHPSKTIIKTWKYDNRGRVKELSEAAGTEYEKTTHYTYTSDGLLHTLTKPDDTTLIYSCDGLGRQTHLESSDGSLEYDYSYDSMGYIKKAHDCKTNKTTKRTYDHFGNLQEEYLSNGQTLSKTYDPLNRVTCITYPDGSQTTYSYDAFHLTHITRLPKNGHAYTHSYTHYDLFHHLKQEKLPLGLGEIEYEVDPLGRRFKTTSPYSEEWIPNFDPNGNVPEYLTKRREQTESTYYDYDDLDQLIQETGHFPNHYQYDSHYNRTEKNGNAYHFNPLHELEATEQADYEQDLNGNRLSKRTSHAKIDYSYDPLDRLIEIRSPQKRYVFSYDPFNRMMTQKVFLANREEWILEKAESYLYDNQNELGVFPHELRILGQGKGAEIGATIAIEKEGTTYIPLHDLYGNIIALLDSSKRIVEEQRFSAFGESQHPQLISSWGYQSKRHIHDLIFFGRRLYDPDTGRWLSPDPKGFSEGPNLYQYTFNNPFLHIDLYGEEVMTRIWEIAGHASMGLAHGGLDFVIHMGFFAMDLGVLGTSLLMYDGQNVRDSYFSTKQSLLNSYESALQNYLGGSDNFHYQEWRAGTTKGIDLGLIATGVYSVGKNAIASSSRLGLKGMPKSSSAESGGIASQNPLKEGGYAKTSTPKVGEFSYAPESAKHYNQYITRGSHAGLLERPYMRSSLVIDEIMQAGKSISDPWKIPGAKRWDVQGSFRGADGTWELVLDPSQKLIYHFTFVGK